MKSAKKFLRRVSSKSNSGKLIYRCAAPEVGSAKVVEAAVDSPSEFNEVEFEEYDPTPYDGGYDIALTYGKPLSPSDAVCYPHSAWDPNSRNLEEFSYGSVIAPYGQELVNGDVEKPQNGSGLARPDVEEKAPNGQELVQVDHKKPQNGSESTNSHEEEKPSYDGNGNWAANPIPSHGCDYWGLDIFSYGNGYGNGYGSGDYERTMVPYQGKEERNDSEYGMEEPQPENDSHLNWVQPYEDLFGGWLWPAGGEGDSCNRHDADKPSNGNQWNGTADYIFGLSYPYGEGNNDSHSYGNPIYGYEKHSPMQPQHMLVEHQEPLKLTYYQDYDVEYGEPLWTPKPTYYQDYDVEHEEPLWTPKPTYYQDYDVEHEEPLWTPKPTYYQDYEEEVHTQTEYVSLYERHSNVQHQDGHSEYSETSWFQNTGYCDAYQEEWPGSKYGSHRNQ